MSDPTLCAMPTVYNGQQFRSRLESTVAWLLDALGLEWQYEPQSFLLPNGVQYMPDFWVPALDLWVEARGYDSPKGRRQIMGFCEQLHGEECWGRSNGELQCGGPRYMVIGPHRMGWSSRRRSFWPVWDRVICVAPCPEHGQVFLPRGTECCEYCGVPLTRNHEPSLFVGYAPAEGIICQLGPLRKGACVAMPDEIVAGFLLRERSANDGQGS